MPGIRFGNPRFQIGPAAQPFGLDSPFGGREEISTLAANTVAPVLSGTTVLSLSTGTWTGSNGTYQRRYIKNGEFILGASGVSYDATGQDGVFKGQVRTFDTGGVPTRWTTSNEISVGFGATSVWLWEDGQAMLWEDGQEIQLEAT